jgi:rubrerythrin
MGGGMNMDVFEFAMNMEREGEEYYRNLVQRTNDEGLKSIFTMLANAEVKHFEVVRQLKENAGHPEMAEDTLFDDTKNVFIRMKEEGQVFNFDVSHKDIYRKALDIEKKSHEFYAEKVIEVDAEETKSLLLRLAEEEKKHIFLMENIIEFISRPETWLENAEWYHLDEY